MIPLLVLAVAFAALYGLAELAAVSNLVALPEYYALLGIGDAVPWALLVAGVVVPVLIFTAALLLGRGRPLLHRALLFAAGLGITHALALSLGVFVAFLQPSLG